jgi:hypothetical protein
MINSSVIPAPRPDRKILEPNSRISGVWLQDLSEAGGVTPIPSPKPTSRPDMSPFAVAGAAYNRRVLPTTPGKQIMLGLR